LKVGPREYGRHVGQLNVKMKVELADTKTRRAKAPRNIKLGIRGRLEVS